MGLDAVVGEEMRQKIMPRGESRCAGSDPEARTEWTFLLMDRMNELMDEEQAQAVMTRCACEYPKSNLQPMRQAYARTHQVGAALQMLQASFETFLRETLALSNELADRVIDLGWGVAGALDGNTIISTKIPKSGNLETYFAETDPALKRQLYCHCPRMRHVLRTAGRISPLYCYCGAGFYKGIWEEILQRPVEVEVLESVLNGGDVCRIAIHLPPDA